MNRKLLSTLAALLVLGGLVGVANALMHDGEDHEHKPAAEEGFTVLFDGSSTDAFRGFNKDKFPEKGWVIEEDGSLHKVAKAGGGDIMTKDMYTDFDFRFEWKVAVGGNSGIMYRVAEGEGLKKTHFTGPEYQILDDINHKDGQDARTSAGALYAMIGCNDKKTIKPIGEWNTSRIVMKDNQVEHWLNGEKVLAYTWGSDEIDDLIENSKFKGRERFMKEAKGHITLQDHNDDVWFRNIRVKDLSTE